VSNDNMGNLEKLGILVIVILVVVVGVVAITPSDTLFPEKGLPGDRRTEVAGNEELVPPLEKPAKGAWRRDDPAGTEVRRLDPWPIPIAKEDLPEPDPVTPDPVTPDPVKPDPVTPDPVKPVIVKPVLRAEPSYRKVAIRPGDTLIGIATRELGDGQRFREIEALNPSVNPLRLKVGDKLNVPTGPAPQRAAERDLTQSRSRAVAAAGERTYVTKPGQNPGDVSTAVYGTSKHWKLIMDYNGIDDPKSMPAHITLRIPAKPMSSVNVAPASTSPKPESNSRKPASTSPKPGLAAADSERRYTVQPDETPGEIAASELGDYSRWRELLEFNGLKSENDLQAGSTIRLPR
jgi:nucleoid-associated protein YgaU